MILTFRFQEHKKLALREIFDRATKLQAAKAEIAYAGALTEADRKFLMTPFQIPQDFDYTYYLSALDGAHVASFPEQAKNPLWFAKQTIDIRKRFWAAYAHKGSTAAALVVGGTAIDYAVVQPVMADVLMPKYRAVAEIVGVEIYSKAIRYSSRYGQFLSESRSAMEGDRKARGAAIWKCCAVLLDESGSLLCCAPSTTPSSAVENGRQLLLTRAKNAGKTIVVSSVLICQIDIKDLRNVVQEVA